MIEFKATDDWYQRAAESESEPEPTQYATQAYIERAIEVGQVMKPELSAILSVRLKSLNLAIKGGVIPGELDSIELAEAIGRIKELTFIMKLLAASSYADELAV